VSERYYVLWYFLPYGRTESIDLHRKVGTFYMDAVYQLATFKVISGHSLDKRNG